MQINIIVKKAGRSINVDTDRLVSAEHAEMLSTVLAASPKLDYVIRYGLTQSLNDAHATDTKKSNATPDVIMAAVEKKRDAIYNGTVRVKGHTAIGNPVERETAKLARQWWKSEGIGAQNAAIGKLRAKYAQLENVEDAKIAELILASYAKQPDTVAKAEATIAAKNKKIENIEIDIADLLPAQLALPSPDNFDDDESIDDETDDES